MSTPSGKQKNDKNIVFHRWLHRSDDIDASYSQGEGIDMEHSETGSCQ